MPGSALLLDLPSFAQDQLAVFVRKRVNAM